MTPTELMRKLYSLCARVRRCTQMIKQAFVSLVSDDTSAYPQVQVSYNGKPVQAVRFSPYGLFSNPPEKSVAFLLSPSAQDSRPFAMIQDMLRRKKNVKEGECGLYNVLTGSYVYLKENGDIDGYVPNNHNVNIEGNCTVNIKGVKNVNIDGKYLINGKDGVELDGGSGNKTGVICGRSKCHFTGLNHADVSPDVKASKT